MATKRGNSIHLNQARLGEVEVVPRAYVCLQIYNDCLFVEDLAIYTRLSEATTA